MSSLVNHQSPGRMRFADATPPLLITMGDPAGIGPEIIARAFSSAPMTTAGCVVMGDVATMRLAAQLVSPSAPAFAVAQLTSPDDWSEVPPGCIGVVQSCSLASPVEWGRISAQAGQAAGECIVAAARLVLAKKASGMVTAPIHKEALAAAGGLYANFPGHTEMLQAQAAIHVGKPTADLPVRMMLVNPDLRTVLVSIHLSLRQAIDAVTFENVLRTIEITHLALSRTLKRQPRIGVAGLNPHAGENGLFGREELEIISPAIAAARASGMDATGPYAPDTVFMRARAKGAQHGEFDVVVAMYHDQGLIPVKYLGVENGVNVTLGLPLIRTSPDHGTAFDLAGTGKADPSSVLAAIAVAREMAEGAMIS